MPLNFPNRARSFDEARHAVRFTGYDGVFEVPFLVDAAALTNFDPTEATEATEEACLAAFDGSRASILDVARRAYARARRQMYFLTTADFR